MLEKFCTILSYDGVAYCNILSTNIKSVALKLKIPNVFLNQNSVIASR